MRKRRALSARGISSAVAVFVLIVLASQACSMPNGDPFRVSKGDVRFFMDWTGFKSLQGDRKTYVEFYFTLSRDQLTFSEIETGYSGAYEIELILAREGRKPEKKTWLGAAQIDSLSHASEKVSLFDVNYFLLDHGPYTLSARVTDHNSGRKGTFGERVSIPQFKEEELSLSEIEFASRIEPATSESKFTKNGILILPNPLHLYGLHLPVLYFYAEIYNLRTGEGDSSTYTLHYAIIDSTGTAAKSCEPKRIKKMGRSAVVAEQTSIVTLGSGTYQLEVNVTDELTGERATQEGTFHVQMPERTASTQDMNDSSFTADQAHRNRDIIAYLATEQELDLYDSFNLTGKKAFIEKFWADRDPTPGTEINEAREEHLKRFTFAAINFRSTTQKEGWKSDMGRVFILYGPPDDIERHPADAEANAWEKWIYEALKGQGNVYFIFGDMEGFGRYTLLHSDLRGERYDENWQQWINRYRGRY